MAAELLAASPNGDISTRAVCEAAGIGAPVLYRQFGDKEGLLSAVVDHGFDRYLETKRQREPSTDPVEDLREGWTSHIAFAMANRNLYRLMNSPAMREPPASALESHRILTHNLERAAALGRLRVSPALAAQMIMSANVGVSLMLISRPATFTDAGMSVRVRDAVHASVLTDQTARRPAADPGVPAEPGTSAAAAQLAALLRQSPPGELSAAESTLLAEWLDRLSDARPPGDVR